MSSLPPWPYPRLVAHRGAGKLAPENTLAALRVGFEHGYRMAEFDVKLSSDGVAFLLHDTTLERTTNGTGRADARSWSELSRLDAGGWHSPRYAGEPLATLASAAAWSRANAVAVNIEIKPSPGRERETGGAVALDVAALWRGAGAPPPLLSSFSTVALAAAAEAVPALPRGHLFDRLPADWIDVCAGLGCVAVHPKHTGVDAKMVRAAHAARLRVVAYTINKAGRVDELLGFGVDSIVTDAVDRLPPH